MWPRCLHLLLCNISRVQTPSTCAGTQQAGAGHNLPPRFPVTLFLTRSVGVGLEEQDVDALGGHLDLSSLVQSSGGFRWTDAEHELESWALWAPRRELDVVSVPGGSSKSSLGKTEAA